MDVATSGRGKLGVNGLSVSNEEIVLHQQHGSEYAATVLCCAECA